MWRPRTPPRCSATRTGRSRPSSASTRRWSTRCSRGSASAAAPGASLSPPTTRRRAPPAPRAPSRSRSRSMSPTTSRRRAGSSAASASATRAIRASSSPRRTGSSSASAGSRRGMDRNLAMEVVRVTEAAALASGRFMGRGDEAAADLAAIEAMKKAFGVIAIDGTVVIGEGAEDAMPMLYVGERVGTGQGPATDVALDALEGAHICAVGGYNAMSVIAIAEHGTFLRVPDTYMEKIACGPEGRGAVDLDRTPTANLKALAEAKGVYVENLTVAILDRPRHNALIEEVRKAGARIKLIDS